MQLPLEQGFLTPRLNPFDMPEALSSEDSMFFSFLFSLDLNTHVNGTYRRGRNSVRSVSNLLSLKSFESWRVRLLNIRNFRLWYDLLPALNHICQRAQDCHHCTALAFDEVHWDAFGLFFKHQSGCISVSECKSTALWSSNHEVAKPMDFP
jgi:hypothetical protein